MKIRSVVVLKSRVFFLHDQTLNLAVRFFFIILLNFKRDRNLKNFQSIVRSWTKWRKKKDSEFSFKGRTLTFKITMNSVANKISHYFYVRVNFYTSFEEKKNTFPFAAWWITVMGKKNEFKLVRIDFLFCVVQREDRRMIFFFFTKLQQSKKVSIIF